MRVERGIGGRGRVGGELWRGARGRGDADDGGIGDARVLEEDGLDL